MAFIYHRSSDLSEKLLDALCYLEIFYAQKSHQIVSRRVAALMKAHRGNFTAENCRIRGVRALEMSQI